MLFQEQIFDTIEGSANLINLAVWLVIILLIIIITLYPIKKAFDIRKSKREGDRPKRRVK